MNQNLHLNELKMKRKENIKQNSQSLTWEAMLAKNPMPKFSCLGTFKGIEPGQ